MAVDPQKAAEWERILARARERGFLKFSGDGVAVLELPGSAPDLNPPSAPASASEPPRQGEIL